MPFHSLLFLYLFLPLGLTTIVIARRLSAEWCARACIVLSAIFIAYGGFVSLLILCISACINYMISARLGSDGNPKALLTIGVIINIIFLAIFKYALEAMGIKGVAFPLGISFYTFGQISFLVERYRAIVSQPTVTSYLCYILFFPKFIAGPIAKPSEFLTQLKTTFGLWETERIIRAAAFFFIGLFKKTVIADQLEPFVSYVFDGGQAASFYSAWYGSFAYGLQLYFDFSGYSDMAIGLAMAVGIMLPLNFDAPYRSSNITDFWRKWHISLGSFLREYVYFPLGGNRKGEPRKYLNLLIVMCLCGMWHGSTINFLVWGAIHGIYLVIHNLWIRLKARAFKREFGFLGRLLGGVLTFVCVCVAWIPFRAGTMGQSLDLWKSMAELPSTFPPYEKMTLFMVTILAPLLIIAFFPTTQSWLRYSSFQETTAAQETMSNKPFEWKINFHHGLMIGCVAVAGILRLLNGGGFIYGNF